MCCSGARLGVTIRKGEIYALALKSPNYISYGVDYCSDSRERIEFNDVIQ